MHVDEEQDSSALLGGREELPHGVDGRVEDGARVVVAPVQVHPAQAAPVVAVDDSVWVEHGHDLEDEVVSQDLRVRVVAAQEPHRSSDHEAAVALSGVNAGAEHDGGASGHLVGVRRSGRDGQELAAVAGESQANVASADESFALVFRRGPFQNRRYILLEIGVSVRETVSEKCLERE